MKILFLHISDAHFEEDTRCTGKIIDAQVQALNSIENFDSCFIMFSGDLAYSGKENEYKNVSKYLGRLWKKIREKFNIYNSVSTRVVPGNHDMNFNGVKRDRSEIRIMLNEGTAEELVGPELQKFEEFYKCAGFYNCFVTNKLCDCKIYTIAGKRIQINLINSELFSSCNDSIHDDDKGLHYLPASVWENIIRKKDVDFVLTMSHRGPEWFDWSTCQAFKKHLFGNADIFLYGHEHFDEVQNMCKKDNTLLKSIAQGLDFAGNHISFTTLLVDLETNQIQTKKFAWDSQEEMF